MPVAVPEEKKEAVKPPEPKQVELGGILVYDAYATIEGGSDRVQHYYQRQVPPRINPYILIEQADV